MNLDGGSNNPHRFSHHVSMTQISDTIRCPSINSLDTPILQVDTYFEHYRNGLAVVRAGWAIGSGTTDASTSTASPPSSLRSSAITSSALT